MRIHIATSTDLPQPAAAGAASLLARLPAILADIAPLPLDRDEPAGPHEALHAQIIAEVKPVGVVEHVLVRNFVDRAAEVLRLRALQADLLTATAGEALRKVLSDLGVRDYFDLAKQWHARVPEAVAAVDAALAAAGLSLGVVRAQALAIRIREVEAIERMIRGAVARRDEMLRQLYGHQALLAERLRNAAAAHEQMVEQMVEQVPEQVPEIEIVPSPVQTGQFVEAGG